MSIFTVPSRREFGWCHLQKMPARSSGWLFFFKSPPVCVLSGWLSAKIHTVAACCVFPLHQDMPQHAHMKSVCLRINLHRQNELYHRPLLWEIFSNFHTLSLSYQRTQSFSEKNHRMYLRIFFLRANNNFDNTEALLKIKGPQNISLIFQAPKTLSVQSRVSVEMPKKPLKQRIPNDCYGREMASLDNSKLSSPKKNVTT